MKSTSRNAAMNMFIKIICAYCMLCCCIFTLLVVLLPDSVRDQTVQPPTVSVPGVTESRSCCPQDTSFEFLEGMPVHLVRSTTPGHVFTPGSTSAASTRFGTERSQDTRPTPRSPATATCSSPTTVCVADFGAMRPSFTSKADWASSTTPPEPSVAAPDGIIEPGSDIRQSRMEYAMTGNKQANTAPVVPSPSGYSEDPTRSHNDDPVPQPVPMAILFALVVRYYTGNPLRGVRRRKRLERRGRARRYAMRSAEKRRAREAAIAARPTVAASDVPQDVEERLADLTGKLRLTRRAASLGDAAVQKLRNTVTSLASNLSLASDTIVRLSTALHGAMRLTKRLERRLSTTIGELTIVNRARDLALKRGDKLERERDEALSRVQRLGEENQRLQTAMPVAHEIADEDGKDKRNDAACTADSTAAVPLREAIVASMDADSIPDDEVERVLVETAPGQPAASGTSSTAPSPVLGPLADALSDAQEIPHPSMKEKLRDAAATDSTAAAPLGEAIVASMDADSFADDEVPRELVETTPGQPASSETSPTDICTTTVQDSLRATIRVLEEKVGEQLCDIESIKTTASENGRAREQVARHASLVEADCEDLDDERGRLLRRVYILQRREREMAAKAARSVTEARAKAAHQVQALETSHKELHTDKDLLTARVQDLERDAQEASSKAAADASRVHDQAATCQVLEDDKDRLECRVRDLETCLQEVSAKAALDAADAQEQADRQAQEHEQAVRREQELKTSHDEIQVGLATRVQQLEQKLQEASDAAGIDADQLLEQMDKCQALESERDGLACHVREAELDKQTAIDKAASDADKAHEDAVRREQELKTSHDEIQGRLATSVQELEQKLQEASDTAGIEADRLQEQMDKCQALESERDGLACHVREAELDKQTAIDKAASDAAEAHEEAVRQAQELKTNHDEVQVRLTTRVQQLEQKLQEASDAAGIDADRLQEQIDKCQALEGERDERVGHVRQAELDKQTAIDKAASDATEAHEQAVRREQELKTSHDEIQGRLATSVQELEQKLQKASDTAGIEADRLQEQMDKCQALESERDGLACHVREAELDKQTAIDKAASDATEAHEQAVRREQELKTNHDEIQVGLATSVQELEQKLQKASDTAGIEADRLQEQMDKCQALESERDGLACHVREAELDKQTAIDKAASDATEAHEHAVRQAQELEMNHDEIQVGFSTRVQQLEQKLQEASDAAGMDADRLQEQIDKYQALEGERDERLCHVREAELDKQTAIDKAASDATEAHEHAVRQAQEQDARIKNSQARLIARIDDPERQAQANSAGPSSSVSDSSVPCVSPPSCPAEPTSESAGKEISTTPPTGTPGGTLQSTGVPARSPTIQEDTVKSPPATPGPERRPLVNVKALFECKKPAIGEATRWFDGYSVKIDDDGNCYGTAWMVVVLMSAAQNPHRLRFLVEKLKEATCPGGAFAGLNKRCQGYVRDFIIYVRTQQNNWSGRDDSDTAFGASLAVDVVKTLQGNVAEAVAAEENSDVEPMWLKLKWGIAIAARALDVWSARANNCALDMKELSTLCQSVVLNMETPEETSERLQVPGGKVIPIASDIVRPAGSLGLLGSLVVDSYVPGKGRSSQDLTGFFASIPKTTSAGNTAIGLAVLKTAIPHCNVWVTPNAGAVFHELARRFTLPDLDGDDEASENILKNQAKSQVEMTMEEVMAVIAAEDAREERESSEATGGNGGSATRGANGDGSITGGVDAGNAIPSTDGTSTSRGGNGGGATRGAQGGSAVVRSVANGHRNGTAIGVENVETAGVDAIINS